MTTPTATIRQEQPTPAHALPRTALRVGAAVALTMSGVTLVTFGLALTAAPDDVVYPYTSDFIAAQWPAEYLWMFPAMLLMMLFVAFVAAIHSYAPPARAIFSLVGLSLAVVAASVLLSTYFIQVSVMPPSLARGQTDGWAMLTMYNPNGVFIALEELGFLLMSLSLAVVAPVFVGATRLERSIRWLFVTSLVAATTALIGISMSRGVDRGYVFEVVVITIVWTTLIVAGPLVSAVFRRAMTAPTDASSVASDRE